MRWLKPTEQDAAAVERFFTKEAQLNGAGSLSLSHDRFKVLVKGDHIIVNYGIRTIYERSSDDKWHDVYNWNVYLLKLRRGRKMPVEVDYKTFLTYDEAREYIKGFKKQVANA